MSERLEKTLKAFSFSSVSFVANRCDALTCAHTGVYIAALPVK